MIQPRQGPPSPLVEHFLDGAVDEGEIDGATYAVCRLYGDDAEMMAIANSPFVNYRTRRVRCEQFDAIATRILGQLPDQIRGAFLWEGVISVPREISRLVPVLAGWAVTDAVEGGCALPYRKHKRITERTRQIPKGLWRHLCAPKFIRRYTRNCDCAIFRRQRARFTTERITAMSRQADLREDPAIREMMQRQMLEMRTDAYAERMDDVIMSRIRQARTELAPVKQHFLARRDKLRRRVLKRATKFAVDAIGRDAVAALASGRPIRLPGQTIQLEVRSRGALAQPGHGGLSIAVLDLESKRLADLCVYYEDTPALDQVAALGLQLQAGLEQEIVADANIIRADDAGLTHPIFAGHKEKRSARGVGLDISQVHGRFLTAWEETRQRERLYWEATGPLWIKAATVFAAGTKAAKTLMPLVWSLVEAEQGRIQERIAHAPQPTPRSLLVGT